MPEKKCSCPQLWEHSVLSQIYVAVFYQNLHFPLSELKYWMRTVRTQLHHPCSVKCFSLKKSMKYFFNGMEQKYIIGSICILKILSSKAMPLFHVTQEYTTALTVIPRMKTCILDVANHMDPIEKWQLKPSKKDTPTITKALLKWGYLQLKNHAKQQKNGQIQIFP